MDEHCSRCGKELIVEKREIDRVIRGSYLAASKIIYKLTLRCPLKTGFWGSFKGSHDTKIISEECLDD